MDQGAVGWDRGMMNGGWCAGNGAMGGYVDQENVRTGERDEHGKGAVAGRQ